MSWWAERVARPHLRTLRTINTLQALTLLFISLTLRAGAAGFGGTAWTKSSLFLLSGLLTLVKFLVWLCWVTWSLSSFVERETSAWRDRLGSWEVEMELTSCSHYPWTPDTNGWLSMTLSVIRHYQWMKDCGDWAVFLWRIKYIRTIKCHIISSTWTNGVKAKEFSRWEL